MPATLFSQYEQGWHGLGTLLRDNWLKFMLDAPATQPWPSQDQLFGPLPAALPA